MSVQLICLVMSVIMSVLAIQPPPSSKGVLLDWTTRMWLDEDISKYIDKSSTKPMPILKSRQQDRKFKGDTGLSLLLPDCPRSECTAKCQHLPTKDQQNEFVLAKKENGEWEVECVLFDKIVLPSVISGLPEARSLGGEDRTRGLTATQPQESQSSPPLKTQTIQGFGPPKPEVSEQAEGGVPGLVVDMPTQEGPVTTQAPQLNCENLFTNSVEKFFSECCMKNGVAESDPRCALKTLLKVMEQRQNKVVEPAATQAPTTVKTTKKMSESFGVTEADIREGGVDVSDTTTAQSAPDPEEVFSASETEKVVWSLTGQISSWRSKYFTVLGFFLVFLVLFLLIIAALIYKLRAAKEASPPTSPGGGAGYGSCAAPEGDRAPLTPATQQAQTFQY